MFKKVSLAFTVLVLTLCLCGCDFFTADTIELLSPPALSEDFKYISKAINESVKTDYLMEYPQSGSNRSAVVQKDIDGDGVNEAFAFYSTKDGETEIMNINAVCFNDEKWKSTSVQTIVAAGVHRVEFCDLDQDGISEILVGWKIYSTSEMQLSVYSFKDGVLTQRMLNRYNHFVICDLDENNTEDILIIDTDTKKQQNTASLYSFSEGAVVQIGKCALDSKVQSFGHPKVSELSSGKAAVYIDSVKGIGAITEVIIYEKGKLLNPLYDEELLETVKTLRAASLSTRDFNGDGVLEIPIQLNVPSVIENKAAEKLYLTNWCSFNGELLTTQATSMVNLIDGYYFNLPSKWVGNIAVLKDTDNRIREIYSYDNEAMTVGDSLLYIRAIKLRDWDKGVYKALSLMEIGRTADSVIACRIPRESGMTYENAVKSFGVYTQEVTE